MKIDYESIYQHIYENFNITTKVDLYSLIYKTIKLLFFKNVDQPEISNYLKKSINNFIKRVNIEITKKEEVGKVPRFYIDENDFSLIGCSYLEIADNDEVKKEKETYIKAFYIEKILLKLDDKLFEKLCALVLKQIGCEIYDVTRKMADEGIDFYGTLNLSSNTKEFFDSKLFIESERIHIVGQAKRYSRLNPIKPKEIREFIGSLLILNYTQGWGIEDKLKIKNLPKKYLKPNDPLISIFITSTFFSENTIALSKEMGIYIKNGEDLSNWLAETILKDVDNDSLEDYLTEILDQEFI